MNVIQLRGVRLAGTWGPLLRRLPGWREESEGRFTDGDGVVETNLTDEGDRRVVLCSWHEEGEDAPKKLLVSPTGLKFEVIPRRGLPKSMSEARYILNHVAFDVPSVEVEKAWLEETVGRCTVLQRASVWDPVARCLWPDAHLFRPPDFYITIRGGFSESRFDHAGWMAHSAAAVNQAAEVLSAIGWPILFGPADLDGSYLVHFQGPDTLVHDFFCPGDDLVRVATRPRGEHV